MARVEKKATEIEHVLNKAVAQTEKGETLWPSMTYEDGVEAALFWVLGEQDEDPMEDE